MSYEIKAYASILDVISIRKILFPDDNNAGADNWLNTCVISISPTSELIVLAKDSNIVICSLKYDPNGDAQTYKIAYSGSIDSDTITCVTCIPIAGDSHHVGPDWTCIVVGCTSGTVRFYTENFYQLAWALFHEDKVAVIKYQGIRMLRYDRDKTEVKKEEVYIVYKNVVCVFDGERFVKALKCCRSTLARAEAGSQTDASYDQLRMFTYKKWNLTDQSQIEDVAVVGNDHMDPFSHLVTASISGGYKARTSNIAPRNQLIIGAGENPFVAWHYAMEGELVPDLGDVARFVASKIKSALPSWITGQTAEPKPSNVTIIPAELTGCRFGLPDEHRTSHRIYLSPDKTLALVTDSHGRITLIDTHQGICLRQWKGYRHAQCAFSLVHEKEHSKRRRNDPRYRQAMFLIFYAPKKGIIEFWPAQQGERLATFSADKNARLFYLNVNMLGWTLLGRESYRNDQTSVVLMDSSGHLKEIVIPFHYAVVDPVNNAKTKDKHLVNRLKRILRHWDDELNVLNEVVNTCQALTVNSIKYECIISLVNCKSVTPNVIMEACKTFFDTSDEPLKIFCENILQLTQLYVFLMDSAAGDSVKLEVVKSDDKIVEENAKENCNKMENTEECKEECEKKADAGCDPNLPVSSKLLQFLGPSTSHTFPMDTQLMLTEVEVNTLQRLLDIYTLNTNPKCHVHTKVSFSDDTKSSQSMSFHDYLQSFQLKTRSDGVIRLKTDIADNFERLHVMSYVLFSPLIGKKRVVNYGRLEKLVAESALNRMDLVSILLSYWLFREIFINVHLESEMHTFSQLIYSVCKDADNFTVDYKTLSPFWHDVRERLFNARRPFHALMTALLCKGVASKLDRDRDFPNERDDIKWEKVTIENSEWDILINQLDSIALVNVVLNCDNITIENRCLPVYDYELDVSLKTVIQKGRGSVSEMVAKWMIKHGFSLDFLTVHESPPTNKTPEPYDTVAINQLKSYDELVKNERLFNFLTLLRATFPIGLESEAIFAYVAWEYADLWQKKPVPFDYFDAMLDALRHLRKGYVQLGVMNLIWLKHIKIHLETFVSLVDKYEKLPRDEVCKPETGFTDVQIIHCVRHFAEFFSVFLDALDKEPTTNPPSNQVTADNMWSVNRFHQSNTASLIDLASDVGKINSDLIYFHHQLLSVMQAITYFHLEFQKPITNLYDLATRELFFMEFTHSDLSLIDVKFYMKTKELVEVREKFIKKFMSAAVESLYEDDKGRINTSVLDTWLPIWRTMVNEWNLDKNKLQAHYAKELYTHGLDTLAEGIVDSISNPRMLIASDLLRIACVRMYHFIFKMNATQDEYFEKLSHLTPPQTAFIKKIAKEEQVDGLFRHCVDMRAIDRTRTLLGYCLRAHGEAGNSMAEQLIYAWQYIKPKS